MERNENGINAAEFLGGNFLKKEDLPEGETSVRIVDVRKEQVQDSLRAKLVADFAEFEKPLILNKTNIKRLANLFESVNTATWRGVITLYVDKDVEYAGESVGGIRVKPLQRPNGISRELAYKEVPY